MKKSVVLLAAVVFLVTTWAGITYVVGNKAEIYYRHMIQESSQLGFVNIVNQSYERGFLQSKATTLMDVSFPVASKDIAEGEETEQAIEEQNVQLVFEHTLYHGPLPYSSGPSARYGLGPAIALIETSLARFSPDQEGLENLLQEIPELKESVSIARIRLDGTTDSLLEVPAFEYEMDAGRISSSGLRIESVYSMTDGSMSGIYDLQNMAFVAPDGGSMAWNGLTGDFDLEQVLPMLYVGSSKAVVGAMELSVPQPEGGTLKAFTMEGMELSSSSSYDGKMVHVEQITTFGGLTIDEDLYGPLVVEAEVKNLDAQVLSDFQQQVVSVYKDADSLDPDALSGMVLPMYLDLFGGLLPGEPEMNIREFSLVTPHGMAEGDFSIKVSGIENVSFDDPLMMLQYLQNVESAANMRMDEKLFQVLMHERLKQSINDQIELAQYMSPDITYTKEQIDKMVKQQLDQQLDMLVAQEYIVVDGAKIKTSMTFKKGELRVNGQAFNLFQAL